MQIYFNKKDSAEIWGEGCRMTSAANVGRSRIATSGRYAFTDLIDTFVHGISIRWALGCVQMRRKKILLSSC